tara:strand:- start:68 stop:1126 length:1059 start_codon:yes stop_codon:yes gene_type:complete
MAYTTIDDPSEHFQTLVWTGDSSQDTAHSFTGNSNLQPDLFINKSLDVDYGWNTMDTSRGIGNSGKVVRTNLGNAEFDINDYFETATSNGFTVGTGDASFNTNTYKYLLLAWKGAGGSTSSNTDGNSTTTVQANTTAGFSIVLGSFTGSTQTYGHGLGVAPDVVFWKNRSNTNSWLWFTTAFDGTHDFGILNQGNAFSATSYDVPTSSVFYGNDDASTNFVAYCFKSIQGFSQFGGYAGSGAGGTNGTFVHTGFRPAFVMIKSVSTATNWQVYNNLRPAYNNINKKMGFNKENIENGSDFGNTSQNNIDFLSNGFRCTTGNTDTNSGGETYIYWAIAEHPFVTSGGIPTVAR